MLNPSLLLSQPAAEPAHDNWLSQWNDKVGFAGVAEGDRVGEVKSGPVVRNLVYQVKWRRPHSVSNGYTLKFSYKTVICVLGKF